MSFRLSTTFTNPNSRYIDRGFRWPVNTFYGAASLARKLKRRLLNSADDELLGTAHAYIVLPAPPEDGKMVCLAECALVLLERIKELASAICGSQAQMLTVDSRTCSIRTFGEGRILSISELFSDCSTILLANPSFLLTTSPPVVGLLEAARSGSLALRVADSSHALYAFAVTRQVALQVDLERAITHLASYGKTADMQCWAAQPNVKVVQPSCGSVDNSPATSGLKDQIRRPSPISPIYLNTALAELFYEPVDIGPVKMSMERLRQALLAQRERSSVPWIFNTLVNEIEYRMGRPILDSFPPEIHLSVTGRCNIECKFCHYTHEQAYSDYVDVDRIAKLDVFRYLHTLRLSSGIGEPTLNPHLPDIIEYVASEFPQIAMNFFTNGTTLNRRGLIDALVYKTDWINVSLNAATRKTWRDLCEKDMFDRLCSNLRDLHRAKRERGAVQPIVYGSMVLTSKNIHELPRMPKLCRSLGIDRFTGIPFFSLGCHYANRYGAAEAFHHCRDNYDQLYRETIREAQTHRVSIEIPMPANQKQVAFGLETRAFYDFAGIEETPDSLSALINGPDRPSAGMNNCNHIWRTAYIGSTDRNLALPEAHYLYPCLGPLANIDFSTQTSFDFPDIQGFREIWNNPVFVKLRAAQRYAGISKVCDFCRQTDSRDPNNFNQIEELLKEWRAESPVALVQLTSKKAR
jgi:molybdenum cofactor biosynthesis enzyme MoaA